MIKPKSIYRFLSPNFQPLFLEYKTEFRPRYGHGQPPHKLLYSIIDKNRKTYEDYLNGFLKFKNVFEKIPFDKPEGSSDPYWNNEYLPGLDIIALYSFLDEFKPETYIEIGSGNSTMVARKSINENSLSSKIISIDPHPRAQIDRISDEVIRKKIEDTNDFSAIFNLKENDILFIDNSHRCLPNSDVTVCFLELLPYLKKGVLIHIHDIYLPYDYSQFMCDRFYSEQYLLAVLLLNTDKYEVILPNYFIYEDDQLNKILNPVWNAPGLKNVERHGGSFWLRVK
jgi:hypothetical protein